jgi:phosphoribosylaminoimidazolecarboxamide formyltransferase/IMP cyclohydrolase
VEPAKDLVARGAEILAVGRTAEALGRAGVPTGELPSAAIAHTTRRESLQLLHPRVHGGLLGDWDDPEQREELERQGIKRIDLVLVELPEPEEADAGPGLLQQLDVGAAAVLRSAACNPGRVVAISDLDDFPAVQRCLDRTQGAVDEDLRFHLARKALQAVSRHDAVMAALSVPAGSVPDSWSIQAQRIGSVPVIGAGGLTGLFAPTVDARAGFGLRLLSGPALTPQTLMDAELAWRVVDARQDAAVSIAQHGGLCGFSVATDGLAMGFARARATDPRGSFGGSVAANREVDLECAHALSANFVQAVLAPGYSAEARAELGSGKIRLLQVAPGGAPVVTCRTTRWGLLLGWRQTLGAAPGQFRTISSRAPEPAEQRGLELAWSLVGCLAPVAVVIADERQLLSVGMAQTSWRDAARVAVMKMPAGGHAAVAACVDPIRFADDVGVLAAAGVTAILHPAGSPRQAEVVERVDRLGLALQIVEAEEGV